MAGEVPREFLDGVAEIVVSPRTLPHPERPGIYTLGECIPLPVAADAGPESIQSRVVLYHGSFAALATVTPGFDWRDEALETLTHELRHHLEWRARAPDLEDFDWAVEQNYARQDGEAFDPAFYLSGAPVGDDAWRVEDDVFLDRIVTALPDAVSVRWGGREYLVPVPREASLPAFLILEGVADPPAGELVLVRAPEARHARPPPAGQAVSRRGAGRRAHGLSSRHRWRGLRPLSRTGRTMVHEVVTALDGRRGAPPRQAILRRARADAGRLPREGGAGLPDAPGPGWGGDRDGGDAGPRRHAGARLDAAVRSDGGPVLLARCPPRRSRPHDGASCRSA